MGKIQVKRCSPRHPLDKGELGWCEEKEVLLVGRGDGTNKEIGEGGGVSFKTDNTLSFDENGVLSVNTAKKVEADNTLPVTSAAVNATVGNIEIILATI